MIKWYHHLACLIAGLFLFNSIPHLVNGISGTSFPTPFSDPPGQGLSHPVTNVCWAFLNIGIGYFLARIGRLGLGNKWGLVLILLSGMAMSLMLASHFVTKVNPYT